MGEGVARSLKREGDNFENRKFCTAANATLSVPSLSNCGDPDHSSTMGAAPAPALAARKSQRSNRVGERPSIGNATKKAAKGSTPRSTPRGKVKASPRSTGEGATDRSIVAAGDTSASDVDEAAAPTGAGGVPEAAPADASISNASSPDASKPVSTRGSRRRSRRSSEADTKAEADQAAGGASAAARTGGDPASSECPFALSMVELQSIVQHYEADELQWIKKADAVPVSFERKLGSAVAKVGDKAALTASMDTWDMGGKGLKKVDFRRVLRSGLKLDATNNLTSNEIDKLFDSITGGGGGAVATIKEIKPKLLDSRRTAATPIPERDQLIEEAAKCKEQAATVLLAIEAVNAYDEAIVELNSKQGHNAPVIAQLGAIVIKRNLKLGEV